MDGAQVYHEVQALCRQHKITKFGVKKVERAYAFEEKEATARLPSSLEQMRKHTPPLPNLSPSQAAISLYQSLVLPQS